jgi:hypothetical protein
MVRAGIFIGVDKTGNLQPLKDAASGAQKMHQWAIKQGMSDKTHAKLITDADGKKVRPDEIYDAIVPLVGGAGIDQLIIYFAGHGININRGEQWLLSDAPVNASAAVNVAGSVELARYCGIQHVVIISDACRVAPEGIQAQNVRGTDIFPNDGNGDRSKPVDQFFACFLGKTAAELKVASAAAENYRALYTDALLDGLNPIQTNALYSGGEPGDEWRYVWPRELERYLETEIPQRVKKLKLQNSVNQNPDAIITSDKRWLARFNMGSVTAQEPVSTPPRPTSGPALLGNVAKNLVRSAAIGKIAFDTDIERAKSAGSDNIRQLANATEKLAASFGPKHFETQCGIKLRGARIIDVFAPRAKVEVIRDAVDLVRIDPLEGLAASVLLRFKGAFGTVIPVISGFLAAVTIEDGEVVDVAYEPSDNTWRWPMYQDRAADIRSLRAVAAASSRQGRFRLERADGMEIARRMQWAKGVDPTLAIYAAYAYHDLQDLDRLREMSKYLRGDVGATFFDLELLGRRIVGAEIRPDSGIVPFTPLLSQGWALLSANRVRLHPALDGIQRNLRDSLWSAFDDAGLEKLVTAMKTMEVR